MLNGEYLNSDIDQDSELFILNEENQYITAEYIENMLKDYGVNVKVDNLEIFQKSMIHKS